MKKRIISILLCLAMCFSLLSLSALAEDAHQHTEECYDLSGEMICGEENPPAETAPDNESQPESDSEPDSEPVPAEPSQTPDEKEQDELDGYALNGTDDGGSKTPITSVTVTGIKAPVVGMTAGESLAGISVAEGAPYSVSALYWTLSDGNWMNPGDAFESGKQYYYELYLIPEDGYEFNRGTQTYRDIYVFEGTVSASDVAQGDDDSVYIYDSDFYGAHNFQLAILSDNVTPADSYTVKFNMNGHGTTAPADQTVKIGEKATQPDAPTGDGGWTFGGWYDDETCNTPFNFDSPITANTEVYAKWNKTPIDSVTVTGIKAPVVGMTAGESLAGISVAGDRRCSLSEYYWVSIEDGSSKRLNPGDVFESGKQYYYELYLIPEDGYEFNRGTQTTRDVYVFEGTVSASDVAQGDDDSVYIYDSDFYGAHNFQLAIISDGVFPAEGYTVNFNMKGHGEEIDPQTVVSGGKATEPTPTAAGYVFSGWYEDSALSEEFDFNTPVTADITLYAKWTQTYTVTFKMKGHGTQVPEQYVENGSRATRPDDPKANGYVFRGWYKNFACTDLFNFNSPITEDTVLYAKWIDPAHPKTGDSSNMLLWVVLLLASGGAVAGGVVYLKKKKR